MLDLKVGTVEKIVETRGSLIEIMVKINESLERAIAYTSFVDNISEGNEVILNTTAKDLNLGTGGYHFVVASLSSSRKKSSGSGHIMKLRYTPMQIKVDCAEEQGSKYHAIFNSFSSLEKMPVLVCGLHSMLSPLAAVLKSINRKLRIAYIMTDGGSLPIDFSNTVHSLRNKAYIDGTVTIGHAFGGDIECVNIYNGLIAAKEILNCHIAIAAMGPGIVGTGTKYGFSGIEQGGIIDAVNDLGGIPVCVPRISFKDKRERHFGISHHSITVLSSIAKTSAYIGIPSFKPYEEKFIKNQISNYDIDKKHYVSFLEFSDIEGILRESEVSMKTMGRGFEEDRDFFLTVGVNAKVAMGLLT